MARFDLLVVGHVTRDEIGGDVRLGGAAAYAARAASALGLRVAVLTAAPPGWPLLRELETLPGITLAVAPSNVATTFVLDYRGPRRLLTLREIARPLIPDDLPPEFRGAPVAYVGPVAGECDGAFVQGLGRGPFVCVGLQGWLRRRGPEGEVVPWESPEIGRLPTNLSLASLSEEDHLDADALAMRLQGARGPSLDHRGLAVAVTRGARGATLYLPASAPEVIRPVPAREVDPTGAGDVFALVLALALSRGEAPPEAGQRAATAAARVVEGIGIGSLGHDRA